jgi:hypothetical protein
MVERGRNKAVCQVIWSADPSSSLRGQFTVQCVEGRTPWDDELRQMEEQYQPVILDGLQRRTPSKGFERPDANRRSCSLRCVAAGKNDDGMLRVSSDYGRLRAVRAWPQ